MSDFLTKRAFDTIELLKNKNFTVSTAESCTGGMVSAYITSVPGASAVFELGIVSYSSRIKNKILSVRSETLKEYGAVSRQTAMEMAAHVRLLGNSDIGVSVTGVAGPDSSEGKLPGTVYIALADSKGVKISKLDIEPKSRDFVREATVEAIFTMINEYIEGGNNNL